MNAISLECTFELTDQVRRRTSWRVRDLSVQVDNGRALLKGRATTWFVKQLAQHAVHDCMPHLRVDNAIVVEQPAEVMPGMPMS